MMATNQPSHFQPGIFTPRRRSSASAKASACAAAFAGKVDALVIAQNVFSVGEMEIVARPSGFSRAMIFGRTPSTAATGRHGAGRVSESRRWPYIGAIVNNRKEVIQCLHCLSPRSPASVNWILASAEVLA